MGDLGKEQGSRLWGVLVTWRRPQELLVMLDSLDSQSIRLEELAVIDNAPSPETRAIATDGSRSTRVDYAAAKENLGPAGGIALGMEQVLSRADDGDWIVLLDDDDPPPRKRSLEELKDMGDELLARDPRIAGIGLATARFDRRSGRLILVSETERASGTPIRGDYIGGNRLPIYRVAAIRDVGVFDPKLFFGFEELDFGLRLRRAGYSLYEYRSPGHREWAESAARAAGGPRWGRSPGFGMPSARVREPTWRDYYNLRNLIYILKKQGRHAAGARVIIVRGIGKPLANLPLAPKIAWANLKLNARACRHALAGKMGRTVEPELKE